MTVAEAKIAARFNSEVYFPRHNLHGYVYSISWVHPRGGDSYISVGVHDLHANSVFNADPEDLKVEDWRCPDYMVRSFIEQEQKKQ